LSNRRSAGRPLQRFTPDPGRVWSIAGITPHQAALDMQSFGKIGPMETATYWLGRRIHRTRRCVPRGKGLPSGIAIDAETNCPARGPVMPRPPVATFRRTAARDITRDRRPALHSPANHDRFADRSGRAPLLGLEGPFSVFERRCAIRSLPVSELYRFDVFGRPGRIGVNPTPGVSPAVRPCGFSPGATAWTIALVSSPR